MKKQKDQISIVFFGTPQFAVPSLQALIDAGYSPTVVTAPDKPVGRKQILTPSPIKELALKYNLPVFSPIKLDDDFYPIFENVHPDLCVVVAYGKIIPERFLAIPRHGFINVHPSLLPAYRGPSPIQSAILDGKKKTGVSIMVLDREVDHGPILAAKPYILRETVTYLEAEKELAAAGAELLVSVIPDYVNGGIKPQEQDHSAATFTKKFSRPDGKIIWSRPAQEIYNQIRALNPEPGTWTLWQGKVLKIFEAEPLDTSTTSKIGSVELLPGKRVVIFTGTVPLQLIGVQLEGSERMDIQHFLAGHSDFPGSMVE